MMQARLVECDRAFERIASNHRPAEMQLGDADATKRHPLGGGVLLLPGAPQKLRGDLGGGSHLLPQQAVGELPVENGGEMRRLAELAPQLARYGVGLAGLR